MQTDIDVGCCVSSADNMGIYSQLHRYCICGENLAECRSLCSMDSGCKGYVIWESAPDECLIATTSSCPASCLGPSNKEIIGPIDPSADCEPQDMWSGGCFIKRGIFLHK